MEYCDEPICLSVCVCVCQSASISLPLDRSSRNSMRRSPVAVAQSSSGGVALCYVLPVLWITSRLAVVGAMLKGAGCTQRRRLMMRRYRGRVWCLWMLVCSSDLWPWPDDLDIQKWPRHCEDVPAVPKKESVGECCQKLTVRAEHRHSEVWSRPGSDTTRRTSLARRPRPGVLQAGPTVWNSLPDFIRDPTISGDCFRRLLKTYLFARY